MYVYMFLSVCLCVYVCVCICVYICVSRCLCVSISTYVQVETGACIILCAQVCIMYSHCMFILAKFVNTNCDYSNYKSNLSEKKFIWAPSFRGLSPSQQRRHSNRNRIWLKITIQILENQESERLGDQRLDCTIQNLIPDGIFLPARIISQQSTTQRTCNI